MARRRRNKFVQNGDILTLKIEEYAFGGKGIARIENEHGAFVLFVPNTLPGQLVKAQVKKSKKNYAECKLYDVLEPSTDEITVPYQPIAGAPYIKLPIAKQHAYKQSSTLGLFKKIGKVDHIEDLFDEFISSPNVYHYRNKMEYAFSAIGYDYDQADSVDEFTLGFKRRGTWWCGENLLKDSGLFDKEVEDQLHLIKTYCEATNLPPWHAPQKKGFFRYLVVRKSYKTDELLFNLVTTSEGLADFSLPDFATYLIELFGQRFAGLLHTINDEKGDRTLATAGDISLIAGKEKIEEEILGLTFEISMKSFFQTNPKCAERLYQKVVDYALEDRSAVDGKIVMDLFCGTGTIGQIIASQAKDVQIIGVDIVDSAIADAEINAAKNGITGISFYADDVGKFLFNHPQYQGNIGTIILDPARAGIAPKTLQKIINLQSNRIVYVSCNPATQARDCEILSAAGYQLKKISLVDQFPHTAHVETVALFEK